jgi:hypothetical protein
MKTYLECLDEAAVILKDPKLALYLKMTLSKPSVELLEKAAEIYAEQSNSHKPVVVRGGDKIRETVKGVEEYLEWVKGNDTPNTPTEPLQAEGSYGAEGAAVADGAAGQNVSDGCRHRWWELASGKVLCDKCGLVKD